MLHLDIQKKNKPPEFHIRHPYLQFQFLQKVEDLRMYYTISDLENYGKEL